MLRTELTKDEFYKAINYIQNLNNRFFWFDYSDFNIENRNLTKSVWDASEWTVEGIVKPTWAELDEFVNLHVLSWASKPSTYESSITRNQKKAATKRLIEKANLLDKQAFTGEGLGHMPGLVQMVEQANQAGQQIPKILLRDKVGNSINVHSQTEIRELLTDLAHHENIIESAHNAVMSRKAEEDSKWRNADLAYADRVEAAKQSHYILTNYETLLEEEIANYNPAALPTELPELKQVLIERLEAAAMKHVQFLRGVVTQQGIDLPATCSDAETAEIAVAQFRYKGALVINSADSSETANNYFDLYKSNIEKVVVFNSPFFTIEGGADPIENEISITNQSINLSLRQTSKLAADMLQVHSEHNSDGGLNIVQNSSHQLDFTLRVKSGKSVVFRLIGRNLCGPTKLKVTLDNRGLNV